MHGKMRSRLQIILDIIGFVSGVITIAGTIHMPGIVNMLGRLLGFMAKWYCLIPIYFICYGLGVYFVMKFILFVMRAIVIGVTKRAGNVSAEARGSDYCLVVIAGVMLYNMFVGSRNLIYSMPISKAGMIVLLVVLFTVCITAFIQCAAYLLFRYGYIQLSRAAYLLPQILHIIVCIQWMVLVVVWGKC